MGNFVLSQLQGIDHLVATAPYHEHSYDLGVRMNSAGFELRDIPEDYIWEGKQRGDNPIVLLQYTLNGLGHLDYEGKAFNIIPGQLMLLCIPHDHCYYLPKEAIWEHMYITASGCETIRMAQYLIQRHGPVYSIDHQSSCIQSMARLIRLCIDGRLIDSLHSSQLLYQLLLDLVQFDEDQNQHSNFANIKNAMDYTREHLHEEIGIEELSNAAQLSRFHFSRIFKEIIGMSPGQWINQQRIKHAAKLLIESDLNMADIANKCGIPDVNYFGKVFKRIQGISPGVFRDSGLYG